MRITTLFLILLLTGLAFRAFADNGYADGIYDMRLAIGNRIFNDVVELRGQNEPIHIIFNGTLKGSVTVPGVFTAPLTGNGRCHPWSGICFFEFSIVAHENGGDFNVFYEAKLNLDGELTGDAYLDNHEHLGSFTAVRRNENP